MVNSFLLILYHFIRIEFLGDRIYYVDIKVGLRRAAWIFILCHYAIICAGQDARLFTNINRTAGLSSNSVTAIVQDHDGFIWIGTKGGINLYDGTRFTHYHSANSSLSSNDVTTMFVDKTGKLYAGFNSDGLYEFDPQLQDFKRYNAGTDFSKSTVHQLYQHDSSSLWVVSDRGIIDIQTQQVLIDQIEGESYQFTCMKYHRGRYWLGSNYGVIVGIDSSGHRQEVSINTKSVTSMNRIFSMLHYDDEHLLIGTQNNGALLFNTSDFTFTALPVAAEIVRYLMQDSDDIIWIATDGNGVIQFDKKGRQQVFRHQYGNENSIASNAVYCVFEDNQGNIWFGTAWDGISVIAHQPKSYKYYYSDFTGENLSGVLSTLLADNHLWFGTDGDGIYTYPPLGKATADIRQFLGANSYPHFIKKINEDYWVGTFKKGLYRFQNNNKPAVNYRTDPELSGSIRHNDVRDIESISTHTFLVATWGGGLSLLDIQQNQFSMVGTPDLDPKNIVVLEKIRPGEFLLGTFGEGLYLYNSQEGRITPLFENQIKNIISILSEGDRIWLGTWGEGLYQMSATLDSLIVIENASIPSNATILSILTAEEGGVYLSSNDAIYHLNREFTTTKIYSQNEQFHINSAMKDNSGRYYFGSTKGVVSFTKEIRSERKVPAVKLLNIRLFDKPMSKKHFDSDFIELEHDQNVLTFEFGALQYPTSSNLEYMAKVEPLNTEWIKMGSQRYITLANLLPGTYHLKLKTVDSEDVTNFTFEILSPWWKTWWAIIIYLSLFILLLFLFRKYTVRLEKLKSELAFKTLKSEKEAEISKIKQKFFINISHEIRTPLTLIIGEMERLISGTFSHLQQSPPIANIRTNSNYILQLLNELLDYGKLDSQKLKLHVAQGDFVKFSKEIFIAFQHLAESKQITYTFETQFPTISVWYDRDQLEKVLFNLLSNAFKYTPAQGRVEVSITSDDQHVTCKVSDTGKGIPVNQLNKVFKRFYQSDNADLLPDQGFGIGLSIVAEIVKLHRGKVWVESEVNKGSTFYVRLPLKKEHFNQDEIIHDFLDSESIELYKNDNVVSEDTSSNESSLSQQNEIILIVEDNKDIRQFITKVLEEEFTVMEAENGRLALEVIKSELPDLIISDVMMPEMDGISLLKRLKTTFATSHIPVILLTARTGHIYKKEGLQLGADDYITKPFNTSMLLARVRNILHNRLLLHEKLKVKYLTQPKELDFLSPDDQFLINLTNIVQQYMSSEKLDAGLITSELGISHSVVYKKLKALTGFTIVEFIRDYRLTQAGTLLTTYRLSVAETCYKVGFSDKKYFSQIFKKKYNMTPSEYAKNKV